MAGASELTILDVCNANVDAALKDKATPISYVDFKGKILSPGSYNSDAATSLVGTLYLNIQDESGAVVADPTWSLYLTGALTTGAGSNVVFVSMDPTDGDNWDSEGEYVLDGDGNTHTIYDPSLISTDTDYHAPTGDDVALVAAVHWKIHGAITVGVASNVSGDLKSNGAITVEAGAKVGNLEALGAITLGPHSVSGTIRATGALTKGGTAVSGEIYIPAQQDACTVHADIHACETALAAALA
jgi:hypothetical protein